MVRNVTPISVLIITQTYENAKGDNLTGKNKIPIFICEKCDIAYFIILFSDPVINRVSQVGWSKSVTSKNVRNEIKFTSYFTRFDFTLGSPLGFT